MLLQSAEYGRTADKYQTRRSALVLFRKKTQQPQTNRPGRLNFRLFRPFPPNKQMKDSLEHGAKVIQPGGGGFFLLAFRRNLREKEETKTAPASRMDRLYGPRTARSAAPRPGVVARSSLKSRRRWFLFPCGVLERIPERMGGNLLDSGFKGARQRVNRSHKFAKGRFRGRSFKTHCEGRSPGQCVHPTGSFEHLPQHCWLL